MRRTIFQTTAIMARRLAGNCSSFSHLRALAKMCYSYVAVNVFKIPKIQYIEIMTTYACNAKCVHCSNEHYTAGKNKRLLTPEKVADILREAAEMDVPIAVFLGGEPMLDDNIYSYVKKCKDLGILPMVGSNGQLFTQENVQMLKESGVFCISMTLYSTDPEVNASITGLPGYLETILRNISIAKSLGVRVQLKTVVGKASFHNGELLRIVDLARSQGVPLSINPIVPTGSAYFHSQEDLLGAVEIAELDQLCRDNDLLTTHFTSNYFGYGCPAGKAYMGITPYGDALGCYFLPVSYGNIWETSLRGIHQRMLKTRLFGKVWPGCPAAYDRQVIDKVIAPCFSVLDGNTPIPVALETHKAYNPHTDALEF